LSQGARLLRSRNVPRIIAVFDPYADALTDRSRHPSGDGRHCRLVRQSESRWSLQPSAV